MTDEVRRLQIDRSIHEFCILGDEKALDHALSTVRNDSSFTKWRLETVEAVALVHPLSAEDAAERYTDILDAYIDRYDRFFDDDEEAREEFRDAFLEREREFCIELHNALSEAVNADAASESNLAD